MNRHELTKQINSMVSEEKEAFAAAKKRRSSISILGTGSVSPKAALSIILLYDDSGSMSSEKANQLKAARTKLLAEFPKVEKIEICFASDLRRGFDHYGQWGSTILRDSIVAATEIAYREIAHRNVLIIIISDGMDEGSTTSIDECRDKIDWGKSQGYQYYAIWIQAGGRLFQQAQQLGIPDLDVEDIQKGIDSLIEGIYGYLETSTLLLTN